MTHLLLHNVTINRRGSAASVLASLLADARCRLNPLVVRRFAPNGQWMIYAAWLCSRCLPYCGSNSGRARENKGMGVRPTHFTHLNIKVENGCHSLIRALSLSNSSLNRFSSLSLFLTIPARLLTDEYDNPNSSAIFRLEKRPFCHREYTIKSLSLL